MFKFRHIVLMLMAVAAVSAEDKPSKEAAPAEPAAVEKISDDELILMEMHNDMFYGADDYFFEHRDVAFVDSVIPAAKLEAIREAVQTAVAQSGSGSAAKPDSKDDTSSSNTSAAPAAASSTDSSGGGTVVADTGSSGGTGGGTGGGTDIPVIPEIPDIPDTGGGDCPT